MRLARSVAAALLAGSTAIAFNVPAISAPLTPDSALRSSVAADGVQTVQWRHRHYGHGPRWDGHGPRWGYRDWRYRDYGYRNYGWGPAIGGLAAGAIIGGAIAGSQAQAPAYSADEVSYCSQRFKSYDPASGTYLGYDGQRHPCP